MEAAWLNGGIVESWNGREWRLVAGGGGMVVWRLHQIMSVRIVFGGTCDDSKLELRGVHQDHVEHILFFTKQNDLITIS